MDRFSAVLLLGSIAISQACLAKMMSGEPLNAHPDSTLQHSPVVSQDFPAVPTGGNSVLGGSIRNIDPVRDQFTLKVFGGQSMKILFDERTHVYRDGISIPLHSLQPEDHASIQTTLDGTKVFALNIHILSKSPEGACPGQVLNYNRKTRILTVSSALFNGAIELSVPADTPIVRIGQARQDQAQTTFSMASSASTSASSFDFTRGTLISATFVSDSKGQAIAKQIAILASPGYSFVFSGNIMFLDLHSDLLVLVDPRDDKSYKISFDPSLFPSRRDIREGEHVTVTTNFDGNHYVARAIAIN